MGRSKKNISHYNEAFNRLAALKSISPTLDLGSGLTVVAYDAAMIAFRQKLDDYNMTLSQVDEKYNLVQAGEKSLKEFSERMLAGVGVKYGKDSNEYEKAGGVRKSERKKPSKKSKLKG